MKQSTLFSFAFLVFLIFLSVDVFAEQNSNLDSEEKNKLLVLDSSLNNSEKIEVDGIEYDVELVSASDSSAVVRIINNEGKDEQSEIIEGDSVVFFDVLQVYLKNSDEFEELGKIRVEIVIAKVVSFSCSDSDGGVRYYSFGKIKIGNERSETLYYEDYCIDEKFLVEYSCDFATSDNAKCLEGCNLDSTYECPEGCKEGACKGIDPRKEDEQENDVDDGKKDVDENESGKDGMVPSGELTCENGCLLDGNCYPFGHRKGGDYCSDERTFVKQLDKELACDNSFQCVSNVCVNSQCVDSGIINKFIAWLKRLFSG